METVSYWDDTSLMLILNKEHNTAYCPSMALDLNKMVRISPIKHKQQPIILRCYNLWPAYDTNPSTLQD